MNSPQTLQTDTIPETLEMSTPDIFFATFKAISDHTRLRILNLLFHRDLFVCEISRLIEHCDSTISAHLAILRDAGYIISERDGRWVKYRINSLGQDVDSLSDSALYPTLLKQRALAGYIKTKDRDVFRGTMKDIRESYPDSLEARMYFWQD